MRYSKATILMLGVFALGCDESQTPTSIPSTPDESDPQLSSGRSGDDRGEEIYGVDGMNFLIVFDSERPERVRRRVRISGTGNEKIVGIDFRPSAVDPADPNDIGKLYGITQTKIYVINRFNGEARNGQALTVPLVGTFSGTGFNPVVDRLRNHSNVEQNLRLNVDDGMTTQDPNLAYAAGDRNFGKDPRVVGTGYTNNDNNPSSMTELYAIDAGQDVLVELNNPNDGQLTTVGALGVRTSDYVGFDIPLRRRMGYASLTIQGRGEGSTLYRINIDTGEARRIGDIGNQAPLVSIAVAP